MHKQHIMPIPAILPAILGLAAQKKQNFMNLVTNWWTTKDQRDREDHVYGQQRKDAMEDWMMQQEYNSPKNQMARFKEAGLNPNLIYGQTNEAPAVRSSEYHVSNREQPKWQTPDVASGIMSYQDITTKQAQTDNIKAMTDIAKQDLVNKALSGYSLALDNVIKSEDARIKPGLADSQLQAAKLSVDKASKELELMEQTKQIALRDDQRRAAQNAQSLREGYARIKQMEMQNAKTDAERKKIEAEMKGILNSQELQELDLKLKRMGIQPGDNMFFRVLGQIINSPDVKKFIKRLGNPLYIP